MKVRQSWLFLDGLESLRRPACTPWQLPSCNAQRGMERQRDGGGFCGGEQEGVGEGECG